MNRPVNFLPFMKSILICVLAAICLSSSASDDESDNNPEPILGYELLSDLTGHWVGANQTAFGFYEWFAFDFRPISASHVHSIYEGGTAQNIITSVFLADYEGKQQIMARNGGWLGPQYRATYFVLDKAESAKGENYYRLVDAVGGADRSYIEFRFTQDSIYMDAYKDNSGTLDQPIHHMGFAGSNRNPSYSQEAIDLFDFPQQVAEVDLSDQFLSLIDPDSALFLEEEEDPFPKADHGHIADLTINIARNEETEDKSLLLFISKERLMSSDGSVNFDELDNSLVRTIDIALNEDSYTTTYLHPDKYYLTVFRDNDGNGYPSNGDYSSLSISKTVQPNSFDSATVTISLMVP